MTYLCNAFSLQMLPTLQQGSTLRIDPVTPKEVALGMLHTESDCVIGHADHARLVEQILSQAINVPIHVPVRRASITLQAGDILYVAQVTGGRLPEGCTTLPADTSSTFVRVQLL